MWVEKKIICFMESTRRLENQASCSTAGNNSPNHTQNWSDEERNLVSPWVVTMTVCTGGPGTLRRTTTTQTHDLLILGARRASVTGIGACNWQGFDAQMQRSLGQWVSGIFSFYNIKLILLPPRVMRSHIIQKISREFRYWAVRNNDKCLLQHLSWKLWSHWAEK